MKIKFTIFFYFLTSIVFKSLQFGRIGAADLTSQTIKTNLYASGQIDANNQTYMYCPTIFYDHDIGRYMYYACAGIAGDYIVHKEAKGIDELNNYNDWIPYNANYETANYNISYALKPSQQVNKFDRDHACDPSVLKEAGIYYMYYGGLDSNSPSSNHNTAIGVATSIDGKIFTRENNGDPIVPADPSFEPNAYGVGQPAVAKASDGYFYMIYTYQATVAPSAQWYLKVIKSLDPLFSTYSLVANINSGIIGAWSVDMVFNPSKNQFIVVGNGSNINNTPQNNIRMNVFDLNFNYINTNYFQNSPGWAFGEGLAMLTNAQREIGREFTPALQSMFTFVGATWGNRPPFPDHITGPIKYAQYEDITPYEIAGFNVNNGWDLGLYNPNTDGNFYIHYGEGHSWFSGQTASTWSNDANAQPFSGDFNADGYYDLGLYNIGHDGMFHIKYGNGSGAFTSETTWYWGDFATGKVVSGDFNADGKFDVGLYNPLGINDNFYLWYGDGTGQFTGQTAWSWSGGINGPITTAKIFSGDFNGDSKWDVGYYNPAGGDDALHIKYGLGSGAFNNETSYSWDIFTNAQVFTGDYNGDGKWDVGLYDGLNEGTSFIRYGDGLGDFDNGEFAFGWAHSATSKVFSGDFIKRKNVPQGYVDTHDCNGFTGWAFDKDSTNKSLTIDFKIDGTIVGSQVTATIRTDVNSTFSITGTHGFSYPLPTTYMDGLTHTVAIYAHDANSGQAIAIGTFTFGPCYAPIPVAALSVASQQCVGNSISIADNSSNTPTSWQWSLVGASPASSSAQNPSVTYSVAGTYSITLVATNANGSSIPVTQTISINASPSVNATSTITCAGNPVLISASGASSYQWSNSLAGSSISVNPNTHTTYTVIGTSAQGCTNTAIATVSINSLPSITVNSATICAGGTATLVASGALTYTWNTSFNGSILTANPTITTPYTVGGSNSFGCSNYATVNIVIASAPAISVNSETICTGTNATLNASGVNTFTWSNGSNLSSITITPTTTTVYSVNGNMIGCSIGATKQATVTVNPLPLVSLSPITAQCATNASLTLVGSPIGGNYSGTGVSGASFNPVTSGIGSFNINYMYTDINGCINNASQTITVSACTSIDELNSKDLISIYPNPTNGELNIDFNETTETYISIELYDVFGKLLLQKNNTNLKKISLSDFSEGIYYLKITTTQLQILGYQIIKIK